MQCVWGGVQDKEQLDSFACKNGRFILKPIDSSGGRAVKIVDRDGYSFETLISEYPKGFIAEEIIQNVDELKQFNPSSLNTVRITTVRLKDSVEIGFCFIRFGRAGKCVDNGFSGGLMCNIDDETGIITSAVDETGKYYILHPDSQLQIVGLRIPRWNEAIELSKELALVIPDNRYTGWDLALTNQGWILVEGNCKSQFIGPQLSERKGIRRKFDSYLEELL